ncbi:ATP-binding protein [Embleya sp. NPDC001921]
MNIAPAVDPIPASLATILGRESITPADLNADNGDPYSIPNIMRTEIHRCANTIPWHYRDAILGQGDMHGWCDALVEAAIADKRRSPVANITRGPSLLLLGPTGVGKTYLAYGAMRHLAVTGVRCAWLATTAADMYAALRPRHGIDSETEFRRYSLARLLVLDDLGAAKDTEWTEEINYRLINHRYEHGLPTLITSNVPVKELGPKLGERVASRLVGMCTRVVLRGDDRRRAAA